MRNRSLPAIAVASLLIAACGAPATRDLARAPPEPGRPPTVAQGASPPASTPVQPGGARRGAYYQDDGPGENPPPNLEATPDAVPVDIAPLRSAANRPYVVFGKTYAPMAAQGEFRQRGVGSWYGRKFHGQRTSSGEPYDMYAMTAAHPTLPLPSFVRVTNAANGRSVVVKVNDRGPFHSERIIDLSYTAALILGYVAQGSAVLEIARVRAGETGPREAARANASAPPTAAITTVPAVAAKPSTQAPSVDAVALPISTQPDGVYLQLGAFGARDGAEEFRIKTYQQLPWLTQTMYIVSQANLHRVHLGPYADRSSAQAIADRIREALQFTPMFVLK